MQWLFAPEREEEESISPSFSVDRSEKTVIWEAEAEEADEVEHL
jgi:hypothetical protein